MCPWRDPPDFELVDLGGERHEIGPNAAEIQECRTLYRRAERVDRFALFLKQSEQFDQPIHVSGYARSKGIVGLAPVKPPRAVRCKRIVHCRRRWSLAIF